MRDQVKRLVKAIMFRVPPQLKKNYVELSSTQVSELLSSIEINYLNRGTTKSKLSAHEYSVKIEDQLISRTHYNRTRIVPWLNHICALKDATVLEVGCGTGASTIALAEQGAKVVGIDVDPGSLQVARDRFRLAGLDAEFHEVNADRIDSLARNSFDFVIFSACLEHMTVEERLSSLSQAWTVLAKNGKLVILETPNRLWYYDSHTAGMPFYDWLPDDLAFYYSKFSERANFRDLYRMLDEEALLRFKRWGRGVSYHEIELAISPLEDLKVISYLNQFEKSFLLKSGLTGLRYRNFLKKISRRHPAFLQPYLDLVIEKP